MIYSDFIVTKLYLMGSNGIYPLVKHHHDADHHVDHHADHHHAEHHHYYHHYIVILVTLTICWVVVCPLSCGVVRMVVPARRMSDISHVGLNHYPVVMRYEGGKERLGYPYSLEIPYSMGSRPRSCESSFPTIY